MLCTCKTNCCGLLRPEYCCNGQLLWARDFLSIILLLKERYDL